MADMYPWNVGPSSLPRVALVRCLSQQREVTNTVTATSWGDKPVCIICSRDKLIMGSHNLKGVLHKGLLGVDRRQGNWAAEDLRPKRWRSAMI